MISTAEPLLPRIVVCGAARNAGDSLSGTMNAIDSWIGAAAYGRCIVVTNDNDDDTTEQLQTWSRANGAVSVIVADGLAGRYRDRLERLAIARNLYLFAARQLAETFDILIVVDLDGVNDAVTPSHLADALNHAPEGWTGVFANQADAYYDLLALRRKGWVEGNVWAEVERLRARFAKPPAKQFNRLFGKRLARQLLAAAERRDVRDKQVKIAPSSPPIEVDSAFGGLGIYRWSAMQTAWYGTRDAQDRYVCDHVALHAGLRAQGGRLYILPSLLNQAPTEHLTPESGNPARTLGLG